MAEFSGSYVLTLAGYNAGPGRAREGIKEFGDPRDGKVDPIDWIHRIPFEETREYVQKVLSNIQIYRARLGERDAVRLDRIPHGRAGSLRRSGANAWRRPIRQSVDKAAVRPPSSRDARPGPRGHVRPASSGGAHDAGESDLRGHLFHRARRPAACAPLSGRGPAEDAQSCALGLTRNGGDFHDLAVALSRRPSGSRTVYTFDYRGRGLSEFDADQKNYAVPIEMLGVLGFITLSGLEDTRYRHLMGVYHADRGAQLRWGCRPQRYRAGREHEGLAGSTLRGRVPADLMGRRRTHGTRAQPPALSRRLGRDVGGGRPAMVQRAQRQAGARL
jgi:hypothetical protein